MQQLSVTFFGFLEFIGTTELLVVLFVALLVFGPRKLPELGRSLGQALSQVRAASDDFKRTWETEALQDGGPSGRRPTPVSYGVDAEGERVPASGDMSAGAGSEAEGVLVGSPSLEGLPAEANC